MDVNESNIYEIFKYLKGHIFTKSRVLKGYDGEKYVKTTIYYFVSKKISMSSDLFEPFAIFFFLL